MADRLPPELLLYILGIADVGPVRFNAVCVAWRETALASRSLWTRIVVDDARPYVTLQRARTFITRANGLPLEVIRGPIEATSSNSERPYASPWNGPEDDPIKVPNDAVSEFVLSVLPWCKSFSYLNVQPIRTSFRLDNDLVHSPAAVRHLRAFFNILLNMRAPRLESMCVSVTWHFAFYMYISWFSPRLPHLARNFPALRSLHLLRICLPLRQLGIPWDRLREFSFQDPCHEYDGRMGLCGMAFYNHQLPVITSLVRGTTLRTLRIKGEHIYGLDKDKPNSIDIEEILLPSLESLTLSQVDLRWPKHEFHLGSGPSCLPHLTSFEIGICSAWAQREARSDDYPACATLLRLLQRMINLHTLTIGSWDVKPEDSPPNTLLVFLPYVRVLTLNYIHADRLSDLYSGLDLPALEHLVIRDFTLREEWHPPIPARWPVRHLKLHIHTDECFYFEEYLEALQTVETIHLEGTDEDGTPWASDYVLEFFARLDVTPHLRGVRCVMCQDVYNDGEPLLVRKESPRPGLVVIFEGCVRCINYISAWEAKWNTEEEQCICTEAEEESDEFEMDSDDLEDEVRTGMSFF